MPKILIADSVASDGLEILHEAGEVVVQTGLSEAELVEIVGDYEAIVVRSATKVTRPIIEAGLKLRIIARAGVGVDNVDVPAATRRGVLVVNSPGGNTLAAAEHTLGMLLAAARMIPQGSQALKEGRWDRKSFMGRQVSGKTLGIVGMGKIGSELARRARALDMRVLVYDPYLSREQAEHLGAEPRDLDALLPESDFITLHAPMTAETKHLIGAAQIAQMKPSAILINCARGGLVDEAALKVALQEKKLAGAALDVFENEPNPDPELIALPQVIATPHLGASTHEAQVNVAIDVARQVVEVLAGGPARWPVNAPILSPEALAAIAPFVPLARALGRLQHALRPAALQRAELRCSADLSPEHLGILTHHFLVGLLEPTVEEPVNYINVHALAQERGVEVSSATLTEDRGYSRLLEAVVTSDGQERVCAGALIRETDARLVNIEGFGTELPLDGVLLLIWNSQPDRPGFIGSFGMLAAEAGINILGIQVARELIGGQGLMAATFAQPVDQQFAERVLGLPGVNRTVVVDFTALA